MSQWEDVNDGTWETPETPVEDQPAYSTAPGDGYQPMSAHEDANPFGVDEVDGLVFTAEETSPELQWEQQGLQQVPMPPQRHVPQPMQVAPAEPWKPGPDPEPVRATPSNQYLRTVIMMAVPLTILLGFAMLVYRFAQAYGF